MQTYDAYTNSNVVPSAQPHPFINHYSNDNDLLAIQNNGPISGYPIPTSIPINLNNNNYGHELAYTNRQHNEELLGISTSEQFQQIHEQFLQNEVEGEQFTVDRLVSEQNQPQNTVDAVTAASFLLAANCYDGVLLHQQPTHQQPSIGLENMPNGYAIGFYPQTDQNCGLSNFSNDSCSSTHNTNFPQPLSISAVGNLIMEDSPVCALDNNNLTSFNSLQTQIVQDPQQHSQQIPAPVSVTTEKVESASVQQCTLCDQQIQERFLLCVNQNYYHSGCLRCSECSTSLEDLTTCYWKQNSLFCKECYTEKFQIKCAHCDRHIQSTDWVRRARSYVYHLACFSCNHCKRQLSTGEQFSLQDSKLLCKQHYLELVQGEDAQQKSKQKRIRTTFADEQLSILQAHFQMDCNPDGADLERIANQTGLSKRVTQVWFQNSRARQKKYQVGGKKTSSTISTDHRSDTGPLGSSNSGRSSPTNTIESSMSPMTMTKSPSIERHALMLTTSDHLMSAAHTMDGVDYV